MTPVLRYSPIGPFLVAVEHRTLILRLTARELQARFKGSVLGVGWLILQPLIMLAIYTFVFSGIFKMRWGEGDETDHGLYALSTFLGLLLYNLVAEAIGRAPTLILENISYVKKVVFPLQVLAWVSLLVALTGAILSFGVFTLGYLILVGAPPARSLLFFVIFLPIGLWVLAGSWLLSSIGVYVRDLKPLLGMLLTMLLFLSPIFYPMSAVPEQMLGIYAMNPLSFCVQTLRSLFGLGGAISLTQMLTHLFVGWLCCWLGYLWFTKTQKGFADVV